MSLWIVKILKILGYLVTLGQLMKWPTNGEKIPTEQVAEVAKPDIVSATLLEMETWLKSRGVVFETSPMSYENYWSSRIRDESGLMQTLTMERMYWDCVRYTYTHFDELVAAVTRPK